MPERHSPHHRTSPPASLPPPRPSPAPPAGACLDNIDTDCVFTIHSFFGSSVGFDMRSLCQPQGYSFVNNSQAVGKRYSFNICGLAADTCTPCGTIVNGAPSPNLPYCTNYSRYPTAPVIQFVNSSESAPDCGVLGKACFDRLQNAPTCCTAACETLAIGTPLWGAIDPVNVEEGGLSLTYFGVVPESSDPYGPNCGINQASGARERSVRINIACDRSFGPGLQVDSAYEDTTCAYVINARSPNACGCVPNCKVGLKQCGSDGCGGFCSGPMLSGECPNGGICRDDQTCCKPDCNGRDCGDDGCGGSCGSCGADETCGSYASAAQTCVSSSANAYVPVAPLVYQSDSSGLAGAYFGGVAAVVVVSMLVNFLVSTRGQALLARNGFTFLLLRSSGTERGGAGQEATSLLSGSTTRASAT